MIVQRDNVFLIENRLAQRIDGAEFELIVKAYKQSIESNSESDVFPVPHINTITSHLACLQRRNILIEASDMCDLGIIKDIEDAACDLMDSYLELKEYADWIDEKQCLASAGFCYTDVDHELCDGNCYTILNSPQLNMIESHQSACGNVCIDSFNAYKKLNSDDSFAYDEMCVDISSEAYCFYIDET